MSIWKIFLCFASVLLSAEGFAQSFDQLQNLVEELNNSNYAIVRTVRHTNIHPVSSANDH